MGYCELSSYKFSVNGWRVGYIKDGSAYLIAAGANECLCTNSDGTTSNSSCSSDETTGGVPLHIANLNAVGLNTTILNLRMVEPVTVIVPGR